MSKLTDAQIKSYNAKMVALAWQKEKEKFINEAKKEAEKFKENLFYLELEKQEELEKLNKITEENNRLNNFYNIYNKKAKKIYKINLILLIFQLFMISFVISAGIYSGF